MLGNLRALLSSILYGLVSLIVNDSCVDKVHCHGKKDQEKLGDCSLFAVRKSVNAYETVVQEATDSAFR